MKVDTRLGWASNYSTETFTHYIHQDSSRAPYQCLCGMLLSPGRVIAGSVDHLVSKGHSLCWKCDAIARRHQP